MTLALNDIQGNIVPGFFKDAQDFLFVRFPSSQAGRAWLAQLREQLSAADKIVPVNQSYLNARAEHPDREPKHDPSRWINVAISYQGFQQLGTIGVDQLPKDFARASDKRRELLGDPLENFATWKVGGPNSEADAVLIQYDGVTQDRFMELELLARYRGQTLNRGVENFGFKDGVSQPTPPPGELKTWVKASPDGQIVAPGEFILGQPDEDGATIFEGPSWASNGSYLVFRRFVQHVHEFEANLAYQSKLLASRGILISPKQLEAKMVGRDKAGNSLGETDFADDPLGDKCPLFAHIRKANPKDRPEEKPNRHRIIRRGITYDSQEDAERGLLFVAYQASISRQFEHIHTQWLGASTFPPPAAELALAPGSNLQRIESPGVDPITGWSGAATRQVLYHRAGDGYDRADFVPLDISTFVDVTGSGYFFSPSLAGIKEILRPGDATTPD